MKRVLLPLLLFVATATVACSSDSTTDSTVASTTDSIADSSAPSSDAIDLPDPVGADVAEPELQAELLEMMAEDQAEQLGEVQTNNYSARTTRLAEILEEYGWPTFDLVGEDGSTAAWVIAQHADLDPDLQVRALELLRVAAGAGQASKGDLAYLEDRVAVAAGRDQSYGTQMGCADDGTPLPATPIADEATVEQRRADAGLDPLADYVAEMTEVCADVE